MAETPSLHCYTVRVVARVGKDRVKVLSPLFSSARVCARVG
jgi:hypothetical protein